MFSQTFIDQQRARLNDHPVYSAVKTLDDLHVFMEHHIFSVWDFMSLVKYLQNAIAPANTPWMPSKDNDLQRFINEIVLEEESDATPQQNQYLSHFELYRQSMIEVGANTRAIDQFLLLIGQKGIDHALKTADIPAASRAFTQKTFDIIRSNEPHRVAAAFTFGREHVIPTMFRAFLAQAGITEKQAPTFHFYLNRHIELDGDHHAPLSLKLAEKLCANNPQLIQQAIETADQAVTERIKLWDGVYNHLKTDRRATA